MNVYIYNCIFHKEEQNDVIVSKMFFRYVYPCKSDKKALRDTDLQPGSMLSTKYVHSPFL